MAFWLMQVSFLSPSLTSPEMSTLLGMSSVHLCVSRKYCCIWHCYHFFFFIINWYNSPLQLISMLYRILKEVFWGKQKIVLDPVTCGQKNCGTFSTLLFPALPLWASSFLGKLIPVVEGPPCTRELSYGGGREHNPIPFQLPAYSPLPSARVHSSSSPWE